jgi:altronate dehydratase large subunit
MKKIPATLNGYPCKSSCGKKGWQAGCLPPYRSGGTITMPGRDPAGDAGGSTKLSCIISFRKGDNVGIALEDLQCGRSYPRITCSGEHPGTLLIPEDQPAWCAQDGGTAFIPRYHKVATEAIPRNAPVVRDGVPIGVASADILPGQPVDQHIRTLPGSVTSREGNIKEYPNLYLPPPESLETLARAYNICREGFDRHSRLRPREEEAGADGPVVSAYPRAGGLWGSRNHVLIIPSVFCVNQEAAEIALPFGETSWGKNGENTVIALPHNAGCCQTGFDEEVTLRTLTNMACHPNVGGVVVVTLGCSPLCVNDRLYEAIRNCAGDKPVFCVRVQKEGRAAALREGIRSVEEMVSCLRRVERKPAPYSGLCLAVKCGGSDPTSGLIANSAIGHVSDWLLDRKGSVVISEIMEYFGAEAILRERCRDHAVWLDLLRIIKANEMIGKSVARAGGLDTHSVELTPGNIQAGLSTQEEKSLGAIRKMGFSHPIENVVRFGEQVTGCRHGLYIMDGPGQDLVSTSGLASSGAQVMLFSTGIGTPLGNAVTPVIKVTGNTETFGRHPDFIDLCIPFRKVVEEGIPERDVALSVLLPELQAVIEGKKTRAEENRHRDFAIRNYTMVQ